MCVFLHRYEHHKLNTDDNKNADADLNENRATSCNDMNMTAAGNYLADVMNMTMAYSAV